MTNCRVTADDYKTALEAICEAGDVARQFRLTGMIEFVRNSTLIATLPTTLKLIREAGHPNIRPMLDCYHFWSGVGKFEGIGKVTLPVAAHSVPRASVVMKPMQRMPVKSCPIGV